MDHANLGQDHDREYGDDRDGDRLGEVERGDAGEDEHAHDFLGRIRRGRDVVGREERKADLLRHSFQRFVLATQRASDEHAADALERLAHSGLRLVGRVLRLVPALAGQPEALGTNDSDDAFAGAPAAFGATFLEVRHDRPGGRRLRAPCTGRRGRRYSDGKTARASVAAPSGYAMATPTSAVARTRTGSPSPVASYRPCRSHRCMPATAASMSDTATR